jgi:hypothetical protein
MMLGERPTPQNAPTWPQLRIVDERDFERERQRLDSFFRALNPDEWARPMCKHLDHHLTQFSG